MVTVDLTWNQKENLVNYSFFIFNFINALFLNHNQQIEYFLFVLHHAMLLIPIEL